MVGVNTNKYISKESSFFIDKETVARCSIALASASSSVELIDHFLCNLGDLIGCEYIIAYGQIGSNQRIAYEWAAKPQQK